MSLNSIATKKVMSTDVRQKIAGSARGRSSFLIRCHVVARVDIRQDLRSPRNVSASRLHHEVLLNQTELVRLALNAILSQVGGA